MVCLPLFAIDNVLKGNHSIRARGLFRGSTHPLESCFAAPLYSYSSLKGVPQYDSPPVPVPVGSPVCTLSDRLSGQKQTVRIHTIKLGISLWKMTSLYFPCLASINQL